MRSLNLWLGAALAGFFSLGIVACHTSAQEGSAHPATTLSTIVPPTQTGSNLPRRTYVAEETKREDDQRELEKKAAKEKSKAETKKPTEKGKPVDEDYVPRGGFH